MSTKRSGLGGSRIFHERVQNAMMADDATYKLIDKVRQSGSLGLYPDKSGQRSFRQQTFCLTRYLASSTGDLQMFSIKNGKRDPRKRTSQTTGQSSQIRANLARDGSPGPRHSCFCDVLGPEICQDCRRTGRQGQFLRDLDKRAALPKIEEKVGKGQLKALKQNPHPTISDWHDTSRPTAEYKDPIKAVSEAQRTAHNLANRYSRPMQHPGKDTQLSKGPRLGLHVEISVRPSKVQSEIHRVGITASGLHKRVIEKHRIRPTNARSPLKGNKV